MDNPYNPPSSNYGGQNGVGKISQRTADIMSRTKGWVRFIAVVLFVNFGISIISTLVAFNSSSRYSSDATRIGGLLATLLLYLYPAVKLNSYANRIGDLLLSGRASDLQAALNEHRGFWRYIGIVTIVLISVALAVMVFGVAMSSSRW